uniref:Uncharacterized protein n=1 Tax=Anguilla anguilla TaxID=7936 RepID=A0A0E9QFM2_ANGAN
MFTVGICSFCVFVCWVLFHADVNRSLKLQFLNHPPCLFSYRLLPRGDQALSLLLISHCC